VDDIAKSAMMFVSQAAKYSDRDLFDVPQAFDIIYDTIEAFKGAHFRSASARRHLVEAVNVTLSSIPGNQVSVRCSELMGGTYSIEWLPYSKRRLAKAWRR
jgi:DNA gyrase inhibitor GyrI